MTDSNYRMTKTTFRLLVEHSANPNGSDFHGTTALHAIAMKSATSFGSTDSQKFVSLLIDALANPHLLDEEGNTPLNFAVVNGDNSLGNNLDSNISMVNTSKSTSIRGRPTASSTTSLVEFLLEKSGSLYHSNKKQRSPFHLAIEKGQKKVLFSLLLPRLEEDMASYIGFLKLVKIDSNESEDDSEDASSKLNFLNEVLNCFGISVDSDGAFQSSSNQVDSEVSTAKKFTVSASLTSQIGRPGADGAFGELEEDDGDLEIEEILEEVEHNEPTSSEIQEVRDIVRTQDPHAIDVDAIDRNDVRKFLKIVDADKLTEAQSSSDATTTGTSTTGNSNGLSIHNIPSLTTGKCLSAIYRSLAEFAVEEKQFELGRTLFGELEKILQSSNAGGADDISKGSSGSTLYDAYLQQYKLAHEQEFRKVQKPQDALVQYAKEGSLKTIKKLLFRSAQNDSSESSNKKCRTAVDPAVPNAEGDYCVTAAIENNHIGLAKWLLEDFPVKCFELLEGEENSTNKALYVSQLQMRFLSLQDSGGETALMKAVRNCKKPVVKRLLELKSDPQLTNEFGQSAVTIAQNWEQADSSSVASSGKGQNSAPGSIAYLLLN